MPRTTLDIDAPVLKDLKRLGKQERKSLGRLASELLAEGLARVRRGKAPPARFEWFAQPLNPRIDLADKEALQLVLDREGLERGRR